MIVAYVFFEEWFLRLELTGFYVKREGFPNDVSVFSVRNMYVLRYLFVK